MRLFIAIAVGIAIAGYSAVTAHAPATKPPVAVANLAVISPQKPAANHSPVPTIEEAQATSPRCSTPAGVCLVPPQPIGSPCTCHSSGGATLGGTIIP